MTLPENWDDWPDNAQTNHLESSMTKAELNNLIREEVGLEPRDNAVDAGALDKHETAVVTKYLLE